MMISIEKTAHEFKARDFKNLQAFKACGYKDI